MFAFLASAATLAQYNIDWPRPTGNNGYDQYVEAAKLVSGPDWNELLAHRSSATPLDIYRLEAGRATGVLELLKQGNALPVSDPHGQITPATLLPEYTYFRRLAVVASNAAYADAADGRLDEAYDWLSEGEKFAYRLPPGSIIEALARQAALGKLEDTAYRLLPRLTARQLDLQVVLAREIADHPVDMEAVAKAETRGFQEVVRTFVADPRTLGIPDGPDMVKVIGSLTDLEAKLKPDGAKLLDRMLKAVPPDKRDDGPATLKALDESGRSLAPKERAIYRKLIPLAKAFFDPPKLDSEAFAKSLDAASLAHAEKIINLYCDSEVRNGELAFAQPESSWGLPWKDRDFSDHNATVMADGRNLRWVDVDFYALRLANGIQELSAGPDSYTFLRRAIQIQREKARLLVIHAELQRYALIHRTLPDTMKPLGSPSDPLSGRPYEYRKLGKTSYSLAAVGVPGVGRIDMDTRVQR